MIRHLLLIMLVPLGLHTCDIRHKHNFHNYIKIPDGAVIPTNTSAHYSALCKHLLFTSTETIGPTIYDTELRYWLQNPEYQAHLTKPIIKKNTLLHIVAILGMQSAAQDIAQMCPEAPSLLNINGETPGDIFRSQSETFEKDCTELATLLPASEVRGSWTTKKNTPLDDYGAFLTDLNDMRAWLRPTLQCESQLLRETAKKIRINRCLPSNLRMNHLTAILNVYSAGSQSAKLVLPRLMRNRQYAFMLGIIDDNAFTFLEYAYMQRDAKTMALILDLHKYLSTYQATKLDGKIDTFTRKSMPFYLPTLEEEPNLPTNIAQLVQRTNEGNQPTHDDIAQKRLHRTYTTIQEVDGIIKRKDTVYKGIAIDKVVYNNSLYCAE